MNYKVWNKEISVKIELRGSIGDEERCNIKYNLSCDKAKAKAFMEELEKPYNCTVIISLERSKKNIEKTIATTLKAIDNIFGEEIARLTNVAAINYKNSDVDRYETYTEEFVIIK